MADNFIPYLILLFLVCYTLADSIDFNDKDSMIVEQNIDIIF